MDDRRVIEETFPLKEVSAESAREKNIRHGHISSLHVWWARRPLAASRAVNYAALTALANNPDGLDATRQFISLFSQWENTSNLGMIEQARKDILRTNNGKSPRVLDPFAGGGAIPLEALRLGCEVHSSDYNPVAVLIQKCTLEYPARYGLTSGGDKWAGLRESAEGTPLLEDVRKWGSWLLREAEKEVGRYYPKDPDGSIPIAYIRAKTIHCQNPTCRVEIPLIRQFWLANRPKKRVALLPYSDRSGINFMLVGDGYKEIPSDFDPSRGTIYRAIVACPSCASVTSGDITRRLFRDGKAGERVIAVVLRHPQRKGRSFRIASARDVEAFERATTYLQEKRQVLFEKWGLEPIPDEPTPEGRGTGAERALSIRNYGLLKWGDLFNPRQQLTLIVFADLVRRVHERMLEEGSDREYAKAVATYMSLAVSKLTTTCNTICRWNNGSFAGKPDQFGTLEMKSDYPECNPFSGVSGSFSNHLNAILSVNVNSINDAEPIYVAQNSAVSLPYSDEYFDAVFTDPPYYDNIPYSYLSDFFYVWLKRMIGHLHPDLFATALTPKSQEIVVYSNRPGGWEEGRRFFEEMLGNSFKEIHRVLRPNGIAVVVYAHKSTRGWETVLNALLDSGLVVTASLPIDTERKGRQRALRSAALRSSIYIVARKMERETTGLYHEIKEKLRTYLESRLSRLWEEGSSGADFFIAAIGSAIEVFGRYETVIDFEGNVVRANALLDDIREIVTGYALGQIFEEGVAADISDLTRLYVLWRWEFGEARVHFDDARKLAQSCGIDLSLEWDRNGFIRKEKEFVRFIGPQDRRFEDLENPNELIDALHLALRQWEKGKVDEMTTGLSEAGFGGETFFRVAQAISQTLPNESKEKKLLDGFLAGRERVREEVRRKTVQTRLM